MMSQTEIEHAAWMWRSAAKVLADDEEVTDTWSAGLAEGYAAALEMVLRA